MGYLGLAVTQIAVGPTGGAIVEYLWGPTGARRVSGCAHFGDRHRTNVILVAESGNRRVYGTVTGVNSSRNFHEGSAYMQHYRGCGMRAVFHLVTVQYHFNGGLLETSVRYGGRWRRSGRRRPGMTHSAGR